MKTKPLHVSWIMILAVALCCCFALPVAADTIPDSHLSHGIGALESEEQPTYQAPVQARTRSLLPESVDLSAEKYFPVIGDQGSRNSCGPWSTTYYAFTYAVARLNNWDAKSNPQYVFSPKWTYNYLNGGANNSTVLDDNLEILKMSGAARWSEFNYTANSSGGSNDYAWCSDVNIAKKALQTRIVEYSHDSFAPAHESTPITSSSSPALQNMKTLLNNKKPLVFRTEWAWRYGTTSNYGSVVTHGESNIIGGHALCIVGYDDTVTYDLNNNGTIEAFERGAFKVANSYGTYYKNNGYVWVMYDALNTVSNAANLNVTYRKGILDDYGYYHFDVANYSPSFTAEVTLNTANRGDLNITIGRWDADRTTPNSTLKTQYKNAGGSFSFAGTTAKEDGVLLVDMDRAVGDTANWLNYPWYINIRDTAANANGTTIKNVKFYKDGAVVSQSTPNVYIDGGAQTYSYPSAAVFPTSIVISPNAKSLYLGSTANLTPTILPANTMEKSVTWTSSNSRVATVDANGLVTAKGLGTATITAKTVNNLTATCVATVCADDYGNTFADAHAITVKANEPSKTNGSLEVAFEDKGDFFKFVAPVSGNYTFVSNTPSSYVNITLYDENQKLLKRPYNAPYTFTYSITAGKTYYVGITHLSTTSQSDQNQYTLEIYPPNTTIEPTDISFSRKVTVFIHQPGYATYITADILPGDATDTTVTWSSSNPEVLSLYRAGNPAAWQFNAPGTTEITATTVNGKTATCKAMVLPSGSTIYYEQKVTVSPATASVAAGQTTQLTATVEPSNATVKTVSWTSSDSNIATVSESGLVTGISAGTATITAKSDYRNRTATCKVTVTGTGVPVTGVAVAPAAASIYEGKTTRLTATISPSNATNKAVTWSSSNTSVAIVDETGLVTGKAAGTATITVKTNNGAKTATSRITVNPFISVTGVTVAPTAASVERGKTVQLTATVAPSNATDKTVTWSTNNAAIATVSTAGVVTGVSAGKATITAKTNDGAKTATSTITVTNPVIPVTGVTVAPTTASVERGKTVQLAATVVPSNATNKAVTWSTNNATVATVSTAGVVTGVAAGTATITVKTVDGAKAATSTVTVTSPTVPVTGVTVTPTIASVEMSKTIQLTATVAPSNATNKAVAWSSSNSGVAKVDANGLVTGLSSGTVTITAKTADGEKTATSRVTVNVPVTGVVVTPATAAVNVGETTKLKVSISPWNATYQGVQWSSSNTSVATVDANGLVKGIVGGTVTVTATVRTVGGNKTATSVITVVIPPSGVSVTPGSASIQLGETVQLTATVTPSDAANKMVTWSSSDTLVAKVDSNGLVTGVGGGTATITAKTLLGNYTSTSTVKVIIPVTGVTISPSATSVDVGKTTQLTAKVVPVNADNQGVTWTSSNTSVATVNAAGLVAGVAAGTATITVKTADGGKTATSNVLVTVPVSSVTVSPTSASVEVGKTTQLTSTVAPTNATNKAVTWISSNTAVATVSTSGLVTGKAVGTATITAKTVDGAKTATSTITVKNPTIAVTGVTVAPTSASVEVGKTTQLTSTVTPTNATNKAVTWTSSNTTVATVSTAGLVTGKVAGTATITVRTVDGAKTATSTITVKNPTIAVTGVTVAPTSASVEVGKTTQLTATVAPTNATNKSVTWTSSNTAVATVSTSGLVTGVSAGTATITVKTVDGAKMATSTIAVTNPVIPVRSVTVAPAAASVEVGKTTQLTATVEPTNATNKDVIWTSSNTSIATVSTTGLVTGKAPGTVMITVKTAVGGKAATSKITVTNPSVEVTNIALNYAAKSIYAGRTVQLKATVAPSNAANQTLTWTSSNTAVATVSAYGLVTGKVAGTATITAKAANGVTATCQVSVCVNDYGDTFANAHNLTVRANQHQQVKGVLEIAGEEKGDVFKFTAPVSGTYSFTYSPQIRDGVYTFLYDENETYIKEARYPACSMSHPLVAGKTYYIKILHKVLVDQSHYTLDIYPPNTAIEPTGISLPYASWVTSFRPNAGHRSPVEVTFTPSDVTDKSITWTSSNPAVATASSTSISYHGVGTTIITATAVNGKTASFKVVLTDGMPVYVRSVAVSPATATVAKGKTAQLTATVLPSDATEKTVSWTSSNPAVATVNANGLVTGVAAGSATVTAKTIEGDKVATATVTVTNPTVAVTGVSVTPATTSVEKGKTRLLTSTVAPSNATNKAVTWTSSNPAVATVNSSGLVAGVSAGTAKITVKTVDGAKVATSTVTVTNPAVIAVTRVTIAPATASIASNESIQLNATVTPSNATNKALTWTSSNQAVAKVDANGLVTGVNNGAATITATSTNGITATSTITVTVTVEPTGVTFNKRSASVYKGTTLGLWATVAPSNATDKTVTWTSSNPAVAFVNNGGNNYRLVTMNGVGTATITATTINGKTATCALTVYDPTEDDYGDTFADAHNLTVKANQAFQISGDLEAPVSGECDMFKFVAPETGAYTIVTTPETYNMYMMLYDENGEFLLQNTEMNTSLTAGKTYYIKITHMVLAEHCRYTVDIFPPRTPILPTGLSFLSRQGSYRYVKDGSLTLPTLTVLPSTVTAKTITWSSSNPSVATVSNGVATYKGVGTTTITAQTVNNKCATFQLTLR